MTTETTQHRPVLIIVAGPNGSGKTTITSKILRHEWLENAVYINPDNVAQEKFGNWNSPEAVLKATRLFHSYFLCRYKPSIYQCFKNSK